MRPPTFRKQAGKKTRAKNTALPNIRPSEFCPVCYLMFGCDERRVFLGDKTVHPQCAAQLAKSIAP